MKKIVFLLLIIAYCGYFNDAYSQTQKDKNSTINQTHQIKSFPADSIITKQWKPYTVPDSLLFNGTQRYNLPNSTFSIIPPKTFRLDNSGNLVHDWTGASIQIKIINTDYLALVKSTKKETFEKQGFSFINQQSIKTELGKEATLYVIGFKANNYEYERVVFFIGNNNRTAWVSANYPVIMKSLLYEVIEHSLLSIDL